MEKIILNALQVIDRVINGITHPCHIVETILPPGEEHPLRSIYTQGISISLQEGNRVYFWLTGMGKDLKVLFVAKLIIDPSHVICHLWTDARAGSKKITRHIYLSRYILVSHLFSILVGKRKGLDEGNRIVSLDPFPDYNKENGNQANEKGSVKDGFFRHMG